MGTDRSLGHKARRRAVGVAIAATLVLVVLVLALAFANSVGAARVAANAEQLHRANATLGTAALTRAAVVQAATFTELAAENLVTPDDLTAAMAEAVDARDRLTQLSLGATAETEARLASFLAGIDQALAALGAGDTGALVARNLRSNGAGRVIVANRTIERAEDVARTLGAEAISFEQLPDALARVDIVITCTGAPEAVLTRELVEPVLMNRDGRALLAIDIAMPRDIAADIYALPGISVHDLDSLQSRVIENSAERQAAARIVEETIEQQLFEFAPDAFLRQVGDIYRLTYIDCLRCDIEFKPGRELRRTKYAKAVFGKCFVGYVTKKLPLGVDPAFKRVDYLARQRIFQDRINRKVPSRARFFE